MSSADVEAVRELLDSEEFINLAKESFDEVDIDQSGYLERDEMDQLCEQLYDVMIDSGYTVEKPTKRDVDKFFNQTDTSGDGRISLEEYIYMIKLLFTYCAKRK